MKLKSEITHVEQQLEFADIPLIEIESTISSMNNCGFFDKPVKFFDFETTPEKKLNPQANSDKKSLMMAIVTKKNDIKAYDQIDETEEIQQGITIYSSHIL